MQNVTKVSSQMSVEVKLSPGLRGEVDADKLNRLLIILNEVSATFAQAQDPSTSAVSGRNTSRTHLPAGGQVEYADSRTDLFSIPESELAEDINIDSHIQVLNSIANTDQPSLEAAVTRGLPESSSSIGPNSDATIDPTIVTMEVNVSIPDVVLDLLYNPIEGHHLVLSLRQLQTTVVMRKYDMQTSFGMNEISIQDSLRAESQRDLIRTPLLDDQNFIKITHLGINNFLSPYYRKHATEVDVQIADLCMNTDVNTVLHLKPFFDVLLTKRGPPAAAASTISSSSSTQSTSGVGNTDEISQVPKGMLLECSFSNFTLDLLRSAAKETKGLVLQTAYAWRVNNLLCRVEIFDLLSAEVKLKSTEVTDTRDVSRNHLFRKIFCPIYDTSLGIDMSRSSSNSNVQLVSPRITTRSSASILDMLSEDSNAQRDNTPMKRSTGYPSDRNLPEFDPIKESTSAESSDAIHVFYVQQSKSISLVNVDILNMASLVDVETVLDFTNVAVSNAFAYLSLLSPSPLPRPADADSNTSAVNANANTDDVFSTPAKPQSRRVEVSPIPMTPYTPTMPLNDESNAAVTNQTTNTMNVSVKVVNPRLLILDDPSAKETSALMLQTEINIHYTRDFTTYTTPTLRPSFSPSRQAVQTSLKKTLDESLHVSITKLNISLLNSIHQWNPKRILQPFSVEFHSRRKCQDDVTVFTKLSADIDSTNARVSTEDLLQVQSILVHRAVEEDAKPQPSQTTTATDATGGNKRSEAESSKDLTWTNTINRRSSMNSAFFSRQYKFDRIITPNRHEGKQPPKFSFSLNVGPMTLVLIDNARQKNSPILRSRFEEITMYAERDEEEDNGRLRGEGSSVVNIEFYHPKLAIWEPVVENWTPSFRLCFETLRGGEQENSFELTSQRPLQVTVSGILLCKLLETFTSVAQTSFHVKPDHVELASSDISLTNSLGLPITVYPSLRCSTRILVLDDINRTALIPKLNKEGRPVQGEESEGTLPVALDIHLGGELAEEKQPLLHLPVNASKALLFHVIQRVDATGSGSNNTVQSDKTVPLGHVRGVSRDSLDSEVTVNDTWRDAENSVFEQVEEEVYEQQRYEPISGVWKAPFLLGDPFHWTDSSCLHSGNMDTESVKNPPPGWHWLDTWHVDLEHEPGETDEEGWEYAPTFNQFGPGTIRRTLQSTDYCRRRRWTRTRAPVSFDDVARPLTVIWEVKTLSSGGKEVTNSIRFQCCLFLKYYFSFLYFSFLLIFRLKFDPRFRFEMRCRSICLSH